MLQQLTAAATISMDTNVEHRTKGKTVFLLTPTADCTINAIPDGLPGQEYELRVRTSGTSSFTITFGTGFVKTGTLATGTADAKTFTVGFTSDGSSLRETNRTAAAS